MKPTDITGLENIRVRYLALVWLILSFYSLGISLLPLGYLGPMDWYWWDLVYLYYNHAFFALALLMTVSFGGNLKIRSVLGRPATRSEYVSGIELTAFLMFLSMATAYALFLPLSFLTPRFVEWWYINVSDLIYFNSENYPFVPNLLSLLSLCVVVPILEEFAFRGIILHRWAHTYGLKSAILVSSLLFGIVHSDPIGASCFGLGMCVLYVKTQSLVLPIICHSLNNFVAWLFELGYVIHLGPEHVYTLQDFQKGWYIGFVCAVVAAVWMVIYFRRRRSEVPWKLPVT